VLQSRPILLVLVIAVVASAARSDPAAPQGAPADARPAPPAELPTGDEVVRRVDARDDGHAVARTLVMELIDKDGSTRTRTTRSFRRDFDDGRRSVLFFETPATVRGTALLTWDYADPSREDDQWLYLPALRKPRRIAVSERGQAFLGTDLTYEEMKKETRLSAEDYRWRSTGTDVVDGHACVVIEGVPADAETERELGYGRVLVRVDSALWLPRFAEYWTPGGDPLKTVRLLDVEPIEGIWTPLRIEVANVQTGHRTSLRFEDVDYHPALPDDLFTAGALGRGAP
jgi:hypothetical protein